MNKHACWSNVTQAACLGCPELVFTPWYLKLNDSLLLRGNVEGCRGGLCLHPDCFLLAVRCSSKCMDLAMHILGGFAKGLVVSGAAACIRLL